MLNRIKRLYEADDVQQVPMNGQITQPVQQVPQPVATSSEMMPPQPAATSSEMMPDFSFEEEPQSAQEALPEASVMNLTVQELLDRCDSINPLVCMGLRQFIDENQEAILSQTTGESPETNGEPATDDTDITFSKAIEPQPAQFSLDQSPQELDFPQA
jgi:hypothetical protein